jgi:hypothetical protein
MRNLRDYLPFPVFWLICSHSRRAILRQNVATFLLSETSELTRNTGIASVFRILKYIKGITHSVEEGFE